MLIVRYSVSSLDHSQPEDPYLPGQLSHILRLHQPKRVAFSLLLSSKSSTYKLKGIWVNEQNHIVIAVALVKNFKLWESRAQGKHGLLIRGQG